MKAIWKGSLSFGLVNIPVQLYSAVTEHALGFRLLCKKCHTPVSYKDWCQHCNKLLTWEDIVKGLKLPNGSYFIITPEKLKKLRPEKTEIISLKEFVPREEVPWIYLKKHLYLGPGKRGEPSYFLFKKALEATHMVGIGQFVMRDKEYVCAIESYEEGLMLHLLNYAYEIRPYSLETKKQPKIPLTQLTLAKHLIMQLSTKKFNIKPYKDTFAQQLTQAIKAGKKSKVKEKKEEKIPRKKNIDNAALIKMLKQSIIEPKKHQQAPIRAQGSRSTKLS